MPDFKKEIRERLAGLRLAPTREAEIVEELAQHFEDTYEDLLAAGAAKADARRKTLDQLNQSDLLTQELRKVERPVSQEPVVLGTRRVNLFWDSLRDLRFGIRMLLKNKAFSTVAVLSLALGIGANTAVFSLVSAVLLRPLPYPEPDKLVMIWERRVQEGTTENAVSPADFRDWRTRNHVFANIAALVEAPLNLSGGNEPERVTAGQVSASFFEVMGIKPMLGRGFLPEEEQAGRNRVAIMNHELWQRSFGADPNMVGRQILLDGISFEVIGVLPPSFRFPSEGLALWLPLNANAQSMQTRTSHFLSVFARLKPDVTIDQAKTEMDHIGAQLMQEYPQENNNHTAFVIPLDEQLAGNLRRPLLILFAAVGLVLLIACANVAVLQLIRAASRQREIAVRIALGAGRWRIARQLLTESGILAVVGGALGILLAWSSMGTLSTLLPQSVLSVTGVPLDLRVFGFTLAISLFTGMLSGLANLLQTARVNFNDTLKAGGRGAGSTNQRARSTMVVIEIGLAIVLLVGAGLLMRSFWKLHHVSPGFDSQDVLTAQIVLPSARYPDTQQGARFFEQLCEQVRALPGVQAVGAISILPLGGGASRTSIAIEGRAEMTNLLPQARPRIHPRVVTPEYFQAMGIPLLNGRVFIPQDNSNTPLVALINQTAAQRYWPGLNPLGQRVQIGGGAPWREVVGIVGDVKHQGLDKEINPEVYFPWAQTSDRTGTLVVRGKNAASLVPALRGEIQQLDKELPLSNLRLLEDVVERSIAAPRSYTLLLAIFAGLALTLATVGIYGVVAHSVALRTREIGVRIALGAQKRDVLRLVMKQGMRLALVGTTLGLAVAWALTRWLKELLFGVGANDPLTIAFVACFLIGVTLLASYLPSRKAAKVDPLIALRHE